MFLILRKEEDDWGRSYYGICAVAHDRAELVKVLARARHKSCGAEEGERLFFEVAAPNAVIESSELSGAVDAAVAELAAADAALRELQRKQEEEGLAIRRAENDAWRERCRKDEEARERAEYERLKQKFGASGAGTEGAQ